MPAAAVSQAASVDWNIVAGAIATFIVTAWVAWSGRQKAKKEEEKEQASTPQVPVITGATLQDNFTLLQQAEAARNHTEELRLSRHATEQLRDTIRDLTKEVERLTQALKG